MARRASLLGVCLLALAGIGAAIELQADNPEPPVSERGTHTESLSSVIAAARARFNSRRVVSARADPETLGYPPLRHPETVRLLFRARAQAADLRTLRPGGRSICCRARSRRLSPPGHRPSRCRGPKPRSSDRTGPCSSNAARWETSERGCCSRSRPTQTFARRSPSSAWHPSRSRSFARFSPRLRSSARTSEPEAAAFRPGCILSHRSGDDMGQPRPRGRHLAGLLERRYRLSRSRGAVAREKCARTWENL